MNKPMYSFSIGDNSYSHAGTYCDVYETFFDIMVPKAKLSICWCIHISVKSIMTSFCFALDMLKDWKVAIGSLWC